MTPNSSKQAYSKDVKVDVHYLTRVEGHGNIVVDVKDGRLTKCEFQVIESPRFFESMLVGRSIWEAQHITSRICGICACGHTLASIQAAENAIGFKPSKQTDEFRTFLMHMEILDSHLLHIYLLVAPDLLGVKSFVPLIDTHNAVVRRALRLKKTVNDICDIFVGRHIHPISSIVGGFTKLPSKTTLNTMLEQLKGMRPDIEATVELAKTLKFPQFERDTEYVGLVSNNAEYPILHGDIGSTDGGRLPKPEYRKATNEFVVAHSSAKHAKWNRASFMNGALARFNLNSTKLRPEAKAVAEAIGLKPKVTNPYLNTAAQLVECVHCLEEAVRILETFQSKGIDYSEEIIVGLNEQGRIKVNPGTGVGAVEVPRGILYHEYTVDEKGIITDANCIIPTSQNVNNIEHDMLKLVPELVETKTEAEITLALEMLVRAYDPCISCSAHFLNVKYVGR